MTLKSGPSEVSASFCRRFYDHWPVAVAAKRGRTSVGLGCCGRIRADRLGDSEAFETIQYNLVQIRVAVAQDRQPRRHGPDVLCRDDTDRPSYEGFGQASA